MGIIEKHRGQICSIHPFIDGSGVKDLYVYSSRGFDKVSINSLPELAKTAEILVCWDKRDIDALFEDVDVIDLKLLIPDSSDLTRLAKRRLYEDFDNYKVAEENFLTHLKVCKQTKVDLSTNSLSDVIPVYVTDHMMSERCKLILSLFMSPEDGDFNVGDQEFIMTYLSRAYNSIERNGVHIDSAKVKKLLKIDSQGQAHSKFLRQADALTKNGKVYTVFNVLGGKTGRIKVASGLGVMSIPKGVSREVIISRFDDGSICSLDFNAIDYRCIISSVPEAVDLYKDCNDFHSRTCALVLNISEANVTNEIRSVIKNLTYTELYGASTETVAKNTGLSIEKVMKIEVLFKDKLRSVISFRDKIVQESRTSGYVTVPGGRQIPVEKNDHPGKLLGLYAQSFSSFVFNNAVVAVNKFLRDKKSVIIFTVHDEIVLDLHPEEHHILEPIKKLMVQSSHIPLQIKHKLGKNYEIATNS